MYYLKFKDQKIIKKNCWEISFPLMPVSNWHECKRIIIKTNNIYSYHDDDTNKTFIFNKKKGLISVEIYIENISICKINLTYQEYKVIFKYFTKQIVK